MTEDRGFSPVKGHTMSEDPVYLGLKDETVPECIVYPFCKSQCKRTDQTGEFLLKTSEFEFTKVPGQSITLTYVACVSARRRLTCTRWFTVNLNLKIRLFCPDSGFIRE